MVRIEIHKIAQAIGSNLVMTRSDFATLFVAAAQNLQSNGEARYGN